MRPYRGMTKEGKWVFGNLIINNAYDLNDGIHVPEPLMTYIVERDVTWVNDPNNRRWTHISYEVIPETVGQSTGLKDKNGKEIYEGDIIVQRNCDGSGHQGEVTIETSRGVMVGNWPICFDLEIIGTIHDKEADHEQRNRKPIE